MRTNNLFVIANVKQMRTDGSFRLLLLFFRTSWGVGVLNSAIFNTFHNRVEFGTILEGLRNFGGGGGVGIEQPNPPRYATDQDTKLNKTTLNIWYCNLEIQDRDIWQAVVSTVMNLWVPYNAGNLFIG